MMMPVKTRFAPSPTGFIHIGNVRTALFSALHASSQQGIFLLRIEDTDLERSTSQYTEALQEDLLWLGLAWQEGPGRGGPHQPYAQSQRLDVYQHYFEILERNSLAYPCFCSETELEVSRKVQLAAGRAPRYAGTCARLKESDIAARLDRGLKPTLRFRVPQGKVVEFTDLVRGVQRFTSDDIGDFIIRRANGSPAFFFTNAVDDALMGVTHVLRGEDHLTNTPRQIMLLAALDLRIPHYAHTSMIVAADGAPLSKRHGSRSIRELRELGFLPIAILNYLGRLGHHYEENKLLNLAQLGQSFRLDHLGRSPARYDNSQLQYWQHEAVLQADKELLWQWMGPAVHDQVPLAQRDAFIETVRENVTFPADAAHWAGIIFANEFSFNDAAMAVIKQAGAAFFAAALAVIETDQLDFKKWAEVVKQQTGFKGKQLFQPLRVALTGELDGPELGKVLPLLTLPRARARLERCLAINE